MSKIVPIPGQPYTIVKGDTLWGIAGRAYGDPTKWPEIYKANSMRLRSGDPDLIFPGEQIIIIPLLAGVPVPFDQLDKMLFIDGVDLVLNGKTVQTESIRVVSDMTAVADGWSATIAWEPGSDPELDAIIKPFSYPKAEIYVQGQKVLTGRLYGTKPSLADRSQLVLEGASYAADMVDSNMKPPYEEAKVTLRKRVTSIGNIFGVQVSFDPAIADGVFDRVATEEGETAAAHVLKLASQRGALVTSTPEGGIAVVRAAFGAPVGTIEEGLPGFTGFIADYDGRKRFNTYRVSSETNDDKKVAITVTDMEVPITRFKTDKVNDLLAGEITNRGVWLRSRGLAEALTIPIVATGHLAPNGKVWAKNTLITVKSPTMFVPSGAIFLIKSVEFVEEASGFTATLQLCPSDSFTVEKQTLAKKEPAGGSESPLIQKLRAHPEYLNPKYTRGASGSW